MKRAALGNKRKTRERKMPDMSAPFPGDPPTGKRLSFTQVPDWVMLCDQLNPTAFRLWCILRSMQFENGPGIPPLTLDEVCWLLPGIRGKPTSKARAKEGLDCLLTMGLLRDITPQGASRGGPRVYLASDELRGEVRWTSARQKFRRYVKLWRTAE